MNLKKYFEFLPNEKCNFCCQKKTDILYGPIYKCKQKSPNRTIVVHYFCLLMASKIEQNGKDNQGILGFFPKDIAKELLRGKSQVCVYCSKNGATVHCVQTGCNRIFHLPCGVDNGSIHQFFNLFNSYCHLHRPKQVVPSTIAKYAGANCPICCLKLDKQNKHDSIWPTCCKPRAFLHRKCVQTMADNAGYYFKCPLCNSAESFKVEMSRIGIYVPEQEASWESEPHAYEELLVRGSGCESKFCSCPQGRNFTKKSSGWQLELCKVCGGNGIHLECSGRWTRKLGYQFNWLCEICKPVYLENKSSRTPERIADSDPTATTSSTFYNCEDFNSSNHSSSTNSDELVVDFSNLRSENVNSTAPKETPSSIQKPDTEDEEVCVVSEGETSADATNHLTCENSLTPVIPAEQGNASTPEKSPAKEVVAQESSDDDCQFVGVIATKRQKKRIFTVRKKYRSALWTATGNTYGSPSTSNVNPTEFPSKTVVGPRIINKMNGESPSTVNAVNKCCNVTSLQLQQPEKLTQQTSTLSQLNQSNNILYLAATSKLKKEILYKTTGHTLPSNVNINLKEVSINRLPSKPSFTPKSQPSVCLSIDISSDEEEPQTSSGYTCQNTQQSVKKTSPSKSTTDKGETCSQLEKLLMNSVVQPQDNCKISKQLSLADSEIKQSKCVSDNDAITLRSMLNLTDSPSISIDKCSKQTSLNQSSKLITEISKTIKVSPNQMLSKGGSSTFSETPIMHVILSSDDEESEETHLPKLRQKGESGMKRTIEGRIIRNKDRESQNMMVAPDCINKIKTSSVANEVSQSIFQGVLNTNKILEVKRKILIVSDDEDDGKGETVNYKKNVCRSDQHFSDELVEQPVDNQEMASAPCEGETLPVSSLNTCSLDFKNNLLVSPEQNSPFCIGIISSVMTLSDKDFEGNNDMFCFEDSNSHFEMEMSSIAEPVAADSEHTAPLPVDDKSKLQNFVQTSSKPSSHIKSGSWSVGSVNMNLPISKTDDDESSCSSQSDQVVSSSDCKNEIEISSSPSALCSCNASCTCKSSLKDHKAMKTITSSSSLPLSEEPVSSTTDSSLVPDNSSKFSRFRSH